MVRVVATPTYREHHQRIRRVETPVTRWGLAFPNFSIAESGTEQDGPHRLTVRVLAIPKLRANNFQETRGYSRMYRTRFENHEPREVELGHRVPEQG